MNEFEALKRLRQETCPATYMPDFDKEECLNVIEKALLELQAIKEAKPSKALGCLEKIGTIPIIVDEKTYDFKPINKAIPDTYNSIKQALLKQLSGSQYTNIFIDEVVKPSEALEWLNQQIQRLNDDLQHYTMVEKDKAIEYQISEDLKELNTIKQALLKAQKLEKAWEIALKHSVNLYILQWKDLTLERYNERVCMLGLPTGIVKLTQQEFELLKEMLELI